MDSSVTEVVRALRRHTSDGCFVCGLQNPIGLQMDGFELNEGVVSARFDPRAAYRGLIGTLHGGISAAAIDEIMVWAGILAEGVVSVTATMDLRYRKPMGVSETITAGARVEERRGRRLRLSGWLGLGDEVAVEGSGLYVVTEQVTDIL